MLADLPVDDVGISVKAAVRISPSPWASSHLTNGDVNFDIDNNHLHQTGTVKLADSRLTVDWTEDFKTTDPITTRLNVKGQLTDAARAALNIGLTTILTGPVGVNGTLTGPSRQSAHAPTLKLDLTPAQIADPHRQSGQAGGRRRRPAMSRSISAPTTISHDETIRLTGPNLDRQRHREFRRQWRADRAEFPVGEDGHAQRSVVDPGARAVGRRLHLARPFAGRLDDRPQRQHHAGQPGRQRLDAAPDETPSGPSTSTPGWTGWRCATVSPSRPSTWI